MVATGVRSGGGGCGGCGSVVMVILAVVEGRMHRWKVEYRKVAQKSKL